jgi:hypothetical protein
VTPKHPPCPPMTSATCAISKRMIHSLALSQHFPARSVHEVKLATCGAGDRLVGLAFVLDVFCRPALHVEPGIRTSEDEGCCHRETVAEFDSAGFAVAQRAACKNIRAQPVDGCAPVWPRAQGASSVHDQTRVKRHGTTRCSSPTRKRAQPGHGPAPCLVSWSRPASDDLDGASGST